MPETKQPNYGPQASTLVRMSPIDPRLPVTLNREQLVAAAAGGAAGEPLDSFAVKQICAALLPALVAEEAAEARARKAERSLSTERLGGRLLEDALRAARTDNALLKRQFEGSILCFMRTMVGVETIGELDLEDPEAFEEETKRGPRPVAATIRRDTAKTRVLDAQGAPR